jgi:hypothetical protein
MMLSIALCLFPALLGERYAFEVGPLGLRVAAKAERVSTESARELEVLSLHESSPAFGVLAVGDRLLATGDADARRQLGESITRAQAGDGRLSLVRERAGVRETVQLPLQPLGAWSSVSLGEGVKAKRVRDAALAQIARRALALASVENSIAALALLAGAQPGHRPLVDAYAQLLSRQRPGLDPVPGMTAWEWGWAGIFLAEHHLATNSAQSKEALGDYARAIARGQSGVGSWGHGMALPNEARSLGGYGALNQSGLGCWLTLILAQRCGIDEPLIHEAIERSRVFFRFHVGKGSIPYGDHPPFWDLHDNNGKNGQAAIAFALLGDAEAARFFTRMSLAAHAERELGHTGNYFGFLWGLLGVHVGGERALAAHFSELAWFFDLARQTDGSMAYPGAPGEDDSYAGWDFTPVIALALCAPKRSLCLTRAQVPLTDSEAEEAVSAGLDFRPAHPREAYAARKTERLLQDLGHWSPVVRFRSAQALARRSEDVTQRLIAMLGSEDSARRAGACHALELQGRKSAPATDPLIEVLRKDEPWLKIRAAYALAGIGPAARHAVPELLRIANAEPDDPRATVRRYLALALFLEGHLDNGPRQGLLSDSLDGVDADSLSAAIERMLLLDDGLARSSVAKSYSQLPAASLERLLPAIRESVRVPAPSGEMFADGVRLCGLKLLAARQDPAGMRLALDYAANQNRWASEHRMQEILAALTSYGAAAVDHLPELERLAAACREEPDFPEDCRRRKTAAVEAAIAQLRALRVSHQRTTRVYLLAGQSNMQGPAVADLDPQWRAADYNHGRGTLQELLKDPAQRQLCAPFARANGEWAVREDVTVSYQLEDGPLLFGPLSVGFSPHGKHHFGPEWAFGEIVGEHCADPVLIVKTAWGGKSLSKDFRPPSSGGELGPCYARMLAELKAATAGVEGDWELAGIVWYQGWNDGCDPNAVPQYEQNLVNLITDLRKEFCNPELRVVVGELTGPWVEAPQEWQQLRAAQRKGAERAQAIFVPTHDFVREAQDSPHPSHGHHEFGNAETYLLVGRALGEAMIGP